MEMDRQLLRTGIPLIDTQHEQYFDLVDELFELIERPRIEQSAVDESLKKVIRYAMEHFDAEEALMTGSRYAHYEKHRAKHDEFRDRTDEMLAMSKKKIPPEEQVVRLGKWLQVWFRGQVLVHDKELAEFLRNRQPGKTL